MSKLSTAPTLIKRVLPNRTEFHDEHFRVLRTEWSNGNQEWFDTEGRLHREDGPAVEGNSGTKKWYRHGVLHREDGPAIKWGDGSEEWLHHGMRHRLGGPAVTWRDGTEEYWEDGIPVSK